MFLSRSTDVLSATCTCVICKISKVKVLIVQQKAISVIVFYIIGILLLMH